jgi:transcriptional regulator with XRE-family HTH domain
VDRYNSNNQFVGLAVALGETFIKNLIRRRKTLRLTQAQFAERIGMSIRGYQKYEQGETSPTPDVIEKFATKLDCFPIDLLSEDQASITSSPLLSSADLARAIQGLIDAGPARQAFLLYMATGDEKFLDRLDEDARQVVANIRIA